MAGVRFLLLRRRDCLVLQTKRGQPPSHSGRTLSALFKSQLPPWSAARGATAEGSISMALSTPILPHLLAGRQM